jgi:hypothetical protein
LLARSAEAQALITESQTLAAELEALYGGLTSSGSPFVPTGGSAPQLAIEARIYAISARYRDLLSSSVELITALPIGASAQAGRAQVQQFLIEDELRDSIATRERIGIGDVELGVAIRALSMQPRIPGRLGVLLTLAGAVRFPTGSDSSLSELVDLRLGTRTTGLNSRAMLDLSMRRFGVLMTGYYNQLFGEPDDATSAFWPTDTRFVEVSVAPRWQLSGPLAIHGAYSVRSANETGSDQLVGGGISFSNLLFTPAGRTPSIDMRFTHLQSLSGDAGRPKFFRDQLELRIYYRLRR